MKSNLESWKLYLGLSPIPEKWIDYDEIKLPKYRNQPIGDKYAILPIDQKIKIKKISVEMLKLGMKNRDIYVNLRKMGLLFDDELGKHASKALIDKMIATFRKELKNER